MRMIPTAGLVLGWICLGFLITLAWTTPSLDWFPDQYTEEFFELKGILALIGTVMLIWHMRNAWPTIYRWAQRLRYIALLYLAVLITYASAEQVRDDTEVAWRHIGSFIGVVLLIVAMCFSLRHDAKVRHEINRNRAQAAREGSGGGLGPAGT